MTQFVKKEVAAGSFLNTLVNKLPFEMHMPGHSFTGSGTELYKRLNPDGPSNSRVYRQNELTTQLSSRFMLFKT